MFADLTENLSNELKITLNYEIFGQCSFSKILSEKSIFEMALNLKEKLYT